MDTIFFGGGCFWCIEAPFNLIRGVKNVTPGYMGGSVKNPTYEMLCSGQTGHAEVIRVEYDSDEVSLLVLLNIFFTIHDPTTLNKQGADEGTQYRSIIFVQQEHLNSVLALLKKINRSDMFTSRLVTEVISLGVEDCSGKSEVVEKTFWPAEDYHHNYFIKNQNNTYCSIVIAPKLSSIKKIYPSLIKL